MDGGIGRTKDLQQMLAINDKREKKNKKKEMITDIAFEMKNSLSIVI